MSSHSVLNLCILLLFWLCSLLSDPSVQCFVLPHAPACMLKKSAMLSTPLQCTTLFLNPSISQTHHWTSADSLFFCCRYWIPSLSVIISVNGAAYRSCFHLLTAQMTHPHSIIALLWFFSDAVVVFMIVSINTFLPFHVRMAVNPLLHASMWSCTGLMMSSFPMIRRALFVLFSCAVSGADLS